MDPTCRLFPPPSQSQSQAQSQSNPHRPSSISTPVAISGNGLKKEKETPWDWIKALINKLANNHQPIEDIDDDDFSLAPTLRGWSWKGKDCDDINKDIHPGVTVPKGNPNIDWNCNGINGTDPKTNTPYEELLCGNSGQMGLIVVGDSFGAHFEIPPSYLNASEINGTTYKDLLYVLENEFDWPERSAFTGFETNSSAIPIDSLYKRLLERNLCNHRDYQNVGVNGARSGAMASNVIKSIARNQTLDSPVLLIYELIGNDVCTPHPDLSRMTTPEEFKANVLESLQYLDSILPNGSHVVFIGLADGRVLWNNLYNRTHPIGVTYEAVYNYLNCLQISPCWVWMNDNETIRDAGSQRAAELSLVYNDIIGNYTFQHFDMVYYDFPFPEINQVWESRGGQTWQLIEPVDGFHPNQIAHSLIAEYLWGQLAENHPSFIGEINPNNAVIQQLFGDQGGY